MKILARTLVAAAVIATALPLAARAAPATDQTTVQAAGMTDVTSRHRHHWRHHHWRHRHVYWHRPHYRHYGWYRGHHYGWYRHHRPYFRHYGWVRDW
jgi:Ni/Co efflux regulator RcnB